MKTFLLLTFSFIFMALISGCSRVPNVVHSIDDVSGALIGALSGTPSERLASELGHVRAFSTGEELMAHLTAGLIDCVIMEASAASELVDATSGVRILAEPLLVYDLRFAIPRENEELLRAVDNALVALRANGTLRGLSDMYFARRRFTYIPPENVAQTQRYLSLAVAPDSPPFSFRDEYGMFFGLDIDVARAVCDILGVELRIIEYDSWELIRAVRYGRADMALGWLPDEADETLINISEPYAVAEHVVIVRRR